MTNSNAKGKRGERAWRDKLREHGFIQSRRGQQFSGGTDSPDVICPELPGIHFEVKYVQKLNMYNAIDQAKFDCGDKVPVVASRKNDAEWLITMRGDDWLNLIKQTEYVTMVFCPDCGTSNIRKNGINPKLNQQYQCLNKACSRSTFI